MDLGNNIVHGTCDGTGAAINVCCGFIPSYVKVWNLEDAGSKLPIAEWVRTMKRVSALDEGYKQIGLDDTDFDRTVLTANGISEYAGGDEIIYDATQTRWESSAGTSVEEVYVDGAYELLHASNPAYRCIGDTLVGKPAYGADNALRTGQAPANGTKVRTPAGFTIGTDSDLNADGERLCWIAIR